MHIGKDDVGGFRKVLQDLIAPKLSTLEVKLDHVIERLDSMESRLIERIDMTRTEILLTIETRSQKERIAELEKQLAEARQRQPAA